MKKIRSLTASVPNSQWNSDRTLQSGKIVSLSLTILTCLFAASGKAEDEAILWYRDIAKAGAAASARAMLNALVAQYPSRPESLKAREFLLSL